MTSSQASLFEGGLFDFDNGASPESGMYSASSTNPPEPPSTMGANSSLRPLSAVTDEVGNSDLHSGTGPTDGGSPQHSGGRVIEIVRQVEALLDELSGLDFCELPSGDRLQITSDLGVQASRLGALRDVAVASLARDRAWDSTGSRTLIDHVRSTRKSSSREASKIVARAQALDTELPLFRAAFVAGLIDEEKIEIVSRHTSEPLLKERLSDPVEGEAYLLERAKAKNTDAFRKIVRAWAMKQSPAITEEAHKQRVRQERLTLVADDDGYTIRGWLTALNGEIVNVALSAMMGVPSKEDTRLPPERRAGSLVELASQSLDQGRSNHAAVVRPHLSVHVPFDVLGKIAASGDDTEVGSIASNAECGCLKDKRQASGHRGHAGHGRASGELAGSEESESVLGEHARLGAQLSEPNSPPGSLPGVPPGPPNLLYVGEPPGIEFHGVGEPPGREYFRVGDPPGRQFLGVGEPPGRAFEQAPETGGGKLGRCIHTVQRERERAREILAVIRAGVDEDLLSGSEPATLDDGTPINFSELQTLLCSSVLQRVVVNQEGEVLDVGRKHRIATKHQAAAVIARDRTCRYPGCDRTIGSSEIHHSQYWRDGGKTDIDNLVMLCWYHHKHVHEQKITITHHRDGWDFSSHSDFIGTTPHGLAIQERGS